MNKNEESRVKELTIKAYSVVAYQYFYEIKDPEFLILDDIESHKGRQKKAARLLMEAGVINPSSSDKRLDRYNNLKYTHGYRINNMSDSQVYAVKDEFSVFWKDYKDACSSLSYEELRYSGYKTIATSKYLYSKEKINRQELLHIFWNQPLYDFYIKKYPNGKINTVSVYPKKYLIFRMKAALRATVELRLEKECQKLLEWALDLEKESLTIEHYWYTNEDYFKKPEKYSCERYEGEAEELKRKIACLTTEFNRLVSVIHKTKELGGYDAVKEKIRRKLIKDIVEDTPIDILDEDKKIISEYILNNSGEFTYESLYGEGSGFNIEVVTASGDHSFYIEEKVHDYA